MTPVCILGDIDLVRAVGLAGLTSVVVSDANDPVRFSRHVVGTLPKFDHWSDGDRQVDTLLRWAATQPERPVLLAQTDGDQLLVSRHRAELEPAFRLLVPDLTLVEDLLDKARFQALAQRLNLPVPRGVLLSEVGSLDERLHPPLVVKPLTRQHLAAVDQHGKAVRIDTLDELRELAARLAASGVEAIVQELVPGPETRVQSWHAYLDPSGEVVGEFCGEKIRTWPVAYGHSSAVRIADLPDVRNAGRKTVEALKLTGLVKVDFKRDPAWRLWLLEINPRATLWLHPGAVAGVNLAALAYADLTGSPRPRGQVARAGVVWCAIREDRWAARASGMSTRAWATQVVRSQARSGATWDDPGPFLRGQVLPALTRRFRRRRSRTTSTDQSA